MFIWLRLSFSFFELIVFARFLPRIRRKTQIWFGGALLQRERKSYLVKEREGERERDLEIENDSDGLYKE